MHNIESYQESLPISENDKKNIQDFIIRHDKKHLCNDGVYSYRFTPFPMGFFGECRCEICGASIPFLSFVY